jgi:hypothetical protein
LKKLIPVRRKKNSKIQLSGSMSLPARLSFSEQRIALPRKRSKLTGKIIPIPESLCSLGKIAATMFRRIVASLSRQL